MSSIFEGFLTTPQAREAFGEQRFVQAMLDVEAALARAQAGCGLIPSTSAQAIAAACEVAHYDVAALVAASGRAGSLAIPLVKLLKEQVARTRPEAVAHTHFGSTSQDVIDTALVLVTRDVLQGITLDTGRAATALLALAEQHAATPILGRTLMQPGSVTSFGLKCANWAAPLVRAMGRLRAQGRAALRVQLGGAVGTLAQMRGKGQAVAAAMAQDLGLSAPEAPWHTDRAEWIALGCELGLLVGSLGKIGRDLALLGQYEIGEVAEPSEPGRGGSSAMPHKRNPVAAMVALAAAGRAPQHVAALLAAMPQEHERALGAWQAELADWPALCLAALGSARALADALADLQVDTPRMRANLDALRAGLPPEAAAEWFDPALAQHAATLAQDRVRALRAEMDNLPGASTA